MTVAAPKTASTDNVTAIVTIDTTVIEAVRQLEKICASKGVSLGTAALAFSLADPDIDVTVVGTKSPKRVTECVRAFAASLSADDFVEMLEVAGNPCFPLSSPYSANPCYTGLRPDSRKRTH